MSYNDNRIIRAAKAGFKQEQTNGRHGCHHGPEGPPCSGFCYQGRVEEHVVRGQKFLIEHWRPQGGGDTVYLLRQGDTYFRGRDVAETPHEATPCETAGHAKLLAEYHADLDPDDWSEEGGETPYGVGAGEPSGAGPRHGLTWDREFTARSGEDVFESVTWGRRDVAIPDHKGGFVYKQDGVLAPDGWSDQAVRVTASKFFYGDQANGNDPYKGGRECSVRQLIDRVCRTVGDWGAQDGYFATREDARRFTSELAWLCLHQHASFNSPVWFNVGVGPAYGVKGGPGSWAWSFDPDTLRGAALQVPDSYEAPQCAACYIQPVEDSIYGIMRLAAVEAQLFKHGSGTGTDVSTLRSCREKVNGGGRASGPVSFMKIWDAGASVVKSGGKCLAPHQPVFTSQGVRTAKELVESNLPFHVLSWSQRLGRMAAKEAKIWRSGSKPVVAVVTDKGEFHVSADHPFMLRNGEPRHAIDLKPGMSLMPASVRKHSDGYVHVRLKPGGGRELFHRMIASDVMGLDVRGHVVYHGRLGKHWNTPENLYLLDDQAEHAAVHANEQVAAGAHIFQTEKFPKPGAANGMHASSGFWSDEAKAGAYRQKQGAILAESGRATDMQEAAARVRMLNTGYRLINAGHDISTFDGYYAARCKVMSRGGVSKDKLGRKFVARFGGYPAFYEELRRGNHAVIEVRPVGTMPVFSIEVIDQEPDDKRAWSEHNYVLAPIGTVKPDFSGVCVFNTRRAAKIQTIKDWHPDVREFALCKLLEDRKARALIQSGAAGDGMTGSQDEAYSSVLFQNSNISVRVSDAFLEAAERPGALWHTQPVLDTTDPETMPSYDAATLLDEMCAATWECGDPGFQFEDTIQRWHTCPESAPIHSSNPCCFVGETLVDTSEGRMTFAELESLSSTGRLLPMVFSFDWATNLPALKSIEKVWVAGRTDQLIEVTTERGLTFRCTPEHVWYLRNGKGVQAKDLKLGDRLRKIGRSEIAAHGGRKMINHRVTKEHPNGCQYQARWMWEQAYGPIPEDMEVHHKNEDCTDDRLSNFVLKSSQAHRILHSAGTANSRYMADVTDHQLVEVWEAIESTPRVTHKNAAQAVTPGRWNAYVRANDLVGKVPLAASPKNGGRIRGLTWAEFSAYIEGAKGVVNDRVVSARRVTLKHPVPVYDASVPGTRNFAIGSDRSSHSVVVSNSEYMFIDNTSCNLASLNLVKFLRPDGQFDVPRFRAAVRTMIVAQDIIVDRAGYPSRAICENSHKFRTLGLGYANLGGLLMSLGLPYDSDEGRTLAGSVTALMHGAALETSAELAGLLGPFPEHEKNAEAMARVVEMHADSGEALLLRAARENSRFRGLADLGHKALESALGAGRTAGYRNAQVTLLAPTGTIGFMMDCDTLGVEPELALVKTKNLAGGGTMRIVNRLVRPALLALGYNDGVSTVGPAVLPGGILNREHVKPDQISPILAYVDEHGTVEGAPGLKPEHLPVFDCAFTAAHGTRSISPDGHIKMMAAVQPFLSGAISKTVNLPANATPADIRKTVYDAWRLGIKAMAIYRDGSKGVQPLNTAKAKPGATEAEPLDQAGLVDALKEYQSGLHAVILGDNPAPAVEPIAPGRRRLPDTRRSLTHKFCVAGHEGYVIVGLYPDGRPGELFVKMTKEGSTLGGVMDALATSVSIGLQYGVPLEVYAVKFSHSRYEPSGATHNPEVPFASSITDYLFRWLRSQFGVGAAPALPPLNKSAPEKVSGPDPVRAATQSGDHMVCQECGTLMPRVGTCYHCPNCSWTTGCS